MPGFSSAQLLSTVYHMFWKGPHINTEILGKKLSRTGSWIKSFYFPLETFSFLSWLKCFDSAYEKLHPRYNSDG